MKHPSAHAKELADAILSDTIAAGQIKEYIPSAQLVELLGIELPEPPVPEELTIDDFSDRDILDEITHRLLVEDVLEKATTTAMLTELKARMVNLTTIQDFYKK